MSCYNWNTSNKKEDFERKDTLCFLCISLIFYSNIISKGAKGWVKKRYCVLPCCDIGGGGLQYILLLGFRRQENKS
jgi:hypothetical protein